MGVGELKKLGFEGAVQIVVDGGATAQLLATSGSFQVDASIPTFVGVDMPPPVGTAAAANRSKFAYAEGTIAVSGSVGFDCTASVLSLMASLCTGRGRRFTVRIAGGEVGQSLTRCYMTSVSLSGSTGGLVSGSLSFISADEIVASAGFTPEHRDPSSATYEEPLAYWYSGGASSADIKDWSLSVSQSATPIYGNVAGKLPLYVRLGATDASLTVSTYLALNELDAVVIATSNVKIIAGLQKSRSFTPSTLDLDTFSHTFESMLDPSVGSAGNIIEFA